MPEIPIIITARDEATAAIQRVASEAASSMRSVGSEANKTTDEMARLEQSAASLNQQLDQVGQSGGLGEVAKQAANLNDVLGESEDKSEALSEKLEKVKTVGAGLAVAGAGGLVLAHSLAEVYEEGARAEAKLDAMMKKRGEGGRIEEISGWASQLSVDAALVDDDPIKEAAAGLLGFGVNADQIKGIMPGLIGQSRLYGQSLESVAEAFGRAFGKGDVGGLTKSGVTIDPAEVKRIQAISDIGERQRQVWSAVKESMDKYALSMTEGLSETEIASNRAANSLDGMQGTVGKGAATAQAQIQGIGVSLLGLVTSNQQASESAGWLFTWASAIATTGGSLLGLSAQLGQTYLAIVAMRAARMADAEAAGVGAAADAAGAAARGTNAAVTATAAAATGTAAAANIGLAESEGAAAAAAATETAAIGNSTRALITNAEAAVGAAAANYRYAASAAAAGGASGAAGGKGLLGKAGLIGTAGVIVGTGLYQGLKATGALGKNAPGAGEAWRNVMARLTGGEVTQENGKTESENKADAEMAKMKADADKAKAESDKMLAGLKTGMSSAALSVPASPLASSMDTSQLSALEDQATLTGDKDEKKRLTVQIRHLKAIERANKAAGRKRTQESKALARAMEKMRKLHIKQADAAADAQADVAIEQLNADFDIRKAQIEASNQTEAQKVMATAALEAERLQREGALKAEGLKGENDLGKDKIRQIASIQANKVLALARIAASKTKDKAKKSGGRGLDGLFGAAALADLGGGSMFNPYAAATYDGASGAFSSVGMNAAAALAARQQGNRPDSAPFWYSNAGRSEMPRAKGRGVEMADGRMKISFDDIILPMDAFRHALGGF